MSKKVKLGDGVSSNLGVIYVMLGWMMYET